MQGLYDVKSIDAEWRPAPAQTFDLDTGRPSRIVVFGGDWVGLTTAAGLASFGHLVVAVDIDEARIDRLSRGDLQGLQEPGLAECVRAQIAAGRLSFCTDAGDALPDARLIFLAVSDGAPDDGSAATDKIDDAARRLAAALQAPVPVVIQSMVPAGTARRVQALLQTSLADPRATATVLVCPSFMRRGSALADFGAPSRIVVGDDSLDDTARRTLLEACKPMIDAGAAVVTMDTRSAELSKPSANAMLAARVSSMNEIAAIATATGADIEKVREGIGSDRRIGTAFLRAGMGYGGPGLAQGVSLLRETARQRNVRADLLLAIERVNDRQQCWAFAALRRDVGSQQALRALHVAVWGLAFKPGTNDVVQAPGLVLIDRLVRAGVTVTLFDPVVQAAARSGVAVHRRIFWARSAEQALAGADVLMLAADWAEFVDVDPAVVGGALRLQTVYDCRNALDAQRWAAAGLRVVQVGRPTHLAAKPVGRRPKNDEVPVVEVECSPTRLASDPFGLAA